jgi:hypothetical protein
LHSCTLFLALPFAHCPQKNYKSAPYLVPWVAGTRLAFCWIDARDNMTGILRLFLTTEHWTNIEAMRTEMASAGYQRVQGYDFLPVQNFEIFAPAPVSH